MSREMELRDADCAQRGCGGTIEEITSPARNKYQARAQRVRGGILLCPVHPVSQQIGRILLSLTCAEDRFDYAHLRQRTIVAQSGWSRTDSAILLLARWHEKSRA